jgi:outer membrane receptor protein involved in Fe transport
MKMTSKRKRTGLQFAMTAIAATVVSSFYVSAALAQETAAPAPAPTPAPDAAASDEGLATIVVTGSRLRRVDTETANPIQTIDHSQLESRGVTTIGDLLQDLPSVSGQATNPQVNNGGGDGASTVSLRGLGSQRTLVLLDGRRLGSSFDVNSIPINMIDHVDILKQGAGATYGTDAIGGVVNIVTRKDFSGAEISYQYGQSTKHDAYTNSVDLTLGMASGKGHAMVGLNYNKQDEIWAPDRKFSKTPLYWYTYNGAVHLLALGSGTGPQSRVTLPGGTMLPNGKTFSEQYGCGSVVRNIGAAGSSLDDYHCYSSADSFDYNPYNLDLTPQERGSLFADAAYSITDSLEIYADALHNQTSSGFIIAPLPMVASNDGWATSADNPFGVSIGSATAGGLSGSNLQVRPLALGNRKSHNETLFDQITAGLRGGIGETTWTWDLALTYQRYENNVDTSGYIQNGLLQPALSGNKFDIFNVTPDSDTGQASLQGLSAISSGYQNRTLQNEKTAEVTFTGDLFTWSQGTAKAAFGGDWRRDYINSRVDDLTRYLPPDYSTCGLAAETCGGNSAGDDTVKELYGEVFLPLVSDQPGIKALNVTVGLRYSNYDSFGNTTNSSIKLEYRPIQDLLVRGTWSQAFRAPTIGDRYGATVGGFPSFSDPCKALDSAKLAANPNLASVCTNVPTDGSFEPSGGSQVLTLYTANPNLDPEKGDVYTAGFVYEPSYVKGLSVAADYWHYHLKDVITSLDATVVSNTCVASLDPYYCGLIHRDAAGQILNIDAPELNAGYFTTDGIDISMKYQFPKTVVGRFQASADATWTHSFKYNFGVGDDETHEAVGTLDPTYGNFSRWRMTAQLQWALAGFEAQWTGRYIAGATISNSPDHNYSSEDYTGGPVYLHQGSVVYHDFALSYHMKTGTKIVAGINNAFDKQPPQAYSFVVNANVDLNTYDAIGRYVFVRLQQTF